MTKTDDIKNVTSLSSLMGTEGDAVDVIPQEVTEPAVEDDSEDMFSFIAPTSADFEVMQGGNESKKVDSPRETYIGYLIDTQNMSIAQATEMANKVYPLETPDKSESVQVTVSEPTKPDVVVVNVDKTDSDKLEFTKEERDKLIVSKAIKLNVLEDQELASIKIQSGLPIGKSKFNFLESFAGKLNQYSIPMMNTGDYATFKAAKAYEIMMAYLPFEGDRLQTNIRDWWSKQATFLYERFVSSTAFPDLEPGQKPTYNQFINHFKFADLEAGMFAVSLSTLNATETGKFKCTSCDHEFDYEYRLEDAFNINYKSDTVKETKAKIINAKYDKDIMMGYVEKKNELCRVKSPDTGIVYDLYLPSIADMLEMGKSFKTTVEDLQSYDAIFERVASYVFDILVPSGENDEYVRVGRDVEYEQTHSYPYDKDEYDPTDDILEMLKMIPESDYELIMTYIGAMVCEFDEVITTTCPHCGQELVFRVNISDQVFTMARGEKTLKSINPGKLLSL